MMRLPFPRRSPRALGRQLADERADLAKAKEQAPPRPPRKDDDE